MISLKQAIQEARAAKKAIGHFNVSTLDALWGVFRAARTLGVPVIIGVSEGERAFIGVRQIAAVVKSIREEFNYPIFLNADHTYSYEKVTEAVEAGFDAVIFDGAELSLEENIKTTKRCVEFARAKNPEIVIEGELGFIGKSSKILDAIPEGVTLDDAHLTNVEDAKRFVEETGVDLLAPAVGNIHGMMKGGHDPKLHIERVKEIAAVTKVPLVLHGGSGNSSEDFKKAIENGVSIVHINTELRVAYRAGLRRALGEDPDEIAPYKYLKQAVMDVEKVATEKLKIFNGI